MGLCQALAGLQPRRPPLPFQLPSPCRCHLETSGWIPISRAQFRPGIHPSHPRAPSPTHAEGDGPFATELKVVVMSLRSGVSREQDGPLRALSGPEQQHGWEKTCVPGSPYRCCCLQPGWDKRGRARRWAGRLRRQHPVWRLSLQTISGWGGALKRHRPARGFKAHTVQ